MTVLADHDLLTLAGPGWYPDPEQRHDLRYHDGERWTEHVTHTGPTPCEHCHDEARH